MGQELAIDVTAARPLGCNLCGAEEHRPLFSMRGYDLVACRSCGLAFIDNPPGAEAIAALYTDDPAYHGALRDPNSAKFRKLNATARQHLRLLRRSVAQPQGLRLLDIGCSTGLFLAQARDAGFEVKGAELSASTAGFARDHWGLDVHAGDWRDAGYADASFDVVTLFDVIEHLPDPLAELRAIRRLLKPGGLLLQSTPDIDGLFPRLSYRLANRLDYWPHPEPPYHLYQFSTRTLTAMTEKAGYRTVRADRIGIGLDYTFGTLADWRRSPKMLAYAALFAPVAVAGAWAGMGDWLYLACRRPAE